MTMGIIAKARNRHIAEQTASALGPAVSMKVKGWQAVLGDAVVIVDSETDELAKNDAASQAAADGILWKWDDTSPVVTRVGLCTAWIVFVKPNAYGTNKQPSELEKTTLDYGGSGGSGYLTTSDVADPRDAPGLGTLTSTSDPRETTTGVFARWQCTDYRCPERAPKESPLPPVCYTCGRPMSRV